MDMKPEVAMSGTVGTVGLAAIRRTAPIDRTELCFVTGALQKLDPYAEGVVCTFRIRDGNGRDRVRANTLGLSSRRV